MNLYHCTKCHHEWQGPNDLQQFCSWCGAPGKSIYEYTPFPAKEIMRRILRGGLQERLTGQLGKLRPTSR